MPNKALLLDKSSKALRERLAQRSDIRIDTAASSSVAGLSLIM